MFLLSTRYIEYGTFKKFRFYLYFFNMNTTLVKIRLSLISHDLCLTIKSLYQGVVLRFFKVEGICSLVDIGCSMWHGGCLIIQRDVTQAPAELNTASTTAVAASEALRRSNTDPTPSLQEARLPGAAQQVHLIMALVLRETFGITAVRVLSVNSGEFFLNQQLVWDRLYMNRDISINFKAYKTLQDELSHEIRKFSHFRQIPAKFRWIPANIFWTDKLPRTF